MINLVNGEQEKGAEPNKNRLNTPTVSHCLNDGTLIELLYRPEERTTAFAVWRNGNWTIAQHVECEGERLVPFSPRNNLIRNEAVLLPSEPREYGSEGRLLLEVKSFIRRHVDLKPTFEQIASYYVLFTWLYDAFNELPYLRLRGDFGTGKTRALLTLGSLCYKPFFASGASTVSPIFHTLDAFQGTLIFDEADFRFSDERAEIVKILNNGNVRGLPVLRTMVNHQREFNPRAFQVFGPKIVATRGRYEDKGLESRFLTEEMGGRSLRGDIPINLPERFKREARELRNKLLLFRFRMRAETRIDESLAEPSLEPRANQILLPLLSIVGDEALRADLLAAAREGQAMLAAERGSSVEGQIIEVLLELMAASDRAAIPVADVVSLLIERYGTEYARPITNRWVGGILRGRLNLHTYKSHGVYVVPMSERSKVLHLCARYGIDTAGDQTSGPGDVGTSGTS